MVDYERMEEEARKYPFLFEGDSCYIYEVPQGWYDLVLELSEKIYEILKRENKVEEYGILQIKEKFGSLRWYDYGSTPEIDTLVEEYELKSAYICNRCGKPAEWISLDWICPWCDECANVPSRFRKINEYYKETKDKK